MGVHLSSQDIQVTVTPERGADITELTDLRTGIQVLAQSPTGKVTSDSAGWGDSQVHWIKGYPGGWQLLVPNAGPERIWGGVKQGFHGEASVARWAVTKQEDSVLELETFLLTAPLRVRRRITLNGASLGVTDVVTNLSPQPASFRMCQHPAFGENFLDETSYLVVGAQTLLSDAENPGTGATPNLKAHPSEHLPRGPVPSSLALPPPGSGQAFFGGFTDFKPSAEDPERTAVTFTTPSKDLAMRLTWDAEVFPHAWFWIEAHATADWPWFRRLYSIAVEPSNVLPGEGPAPEGLIRGGPGVTLQADETLTSHLFLEAMSTSDK
jgi:galactose mutarotase-like enzyme